MTSFTARCAATLAIAALTTACGSAKFSASAFDDEPAGDSSTAGDTNASVDTGGPGPSDTKDPPKKDSDLPGEDTGTPVPDTGSGPVTLDNVCDRLATATCTPAFSACCSTKGFAYNASGCRAAVMATCDEQVKAAKTGKVTFSAAVFPFCAAALNTLASKCSVPVLEFLRTYAECNQLLQGFTSPGSPCSEDWQCKVGEGAFAACNREGRCESLAVVGKDATCTYAGFTRAICTYGQACYFSSGASGVCGAAKAIGASCNNSLECGFGNWCQRDITGLSSKCVAGGGLGASCTENVQCASSGCAGGKCTDPFTTLASPELCTGAPG